MSIIEVYRKFCQKLQFQKYIYIYIHSHSNATSKFIIQFLYYSYTKNKKRSYKNEEPSRNIAK